jgi:hypothetical protein
VLVVLDAECRRQDEDSDVKHLRAFHVECVVWMSPGNMGSDVFQKGICHCVWLLCAFVLPCLKQCDVAHSKQYTLEVPLWIFNAKRQACARHETSKLISHVAKCTCKAIFNTSFTDKALEFLPRLL